MSAQQYATLTVTVALTAAATANRYIGLNGAAAAAGGAGVGVARTAGAIGERIAVDVTGTAVVEAGAAIAANALIECNASGQAITRNTGTPLGRLAPGESASAAGQLVEVILFTN